MYVLVNARRVVGFCVVSLAALALGWHERHRIRGLVERTAHSNPLAAPPVLARVGEPTPMSTVVAEPIFIGGRKPNWQDWGWGPHDDVPNGPARIDMSGWRAGSSAARRVPSPPAGNASYMLRNCSGKYQSPRNPVYGARTSLSRGIVAATAPRTSRTFAAGTTSGNAGAMTVRVPLV